MKFLKKVFFAFIVFSIAWLGILAFNRITDGFSIHQMTSSLPIIPQFDISPPSSAEKAHLQDIVSQPYRYLGKGCQFYVFESADGKYVIKFLKHKHLRPFIWLRKLPLRGGLKNSAELKIAKRQARVETLFSSCKLAYDALAQETGLLFIHLNRVPCLEKTITLIDKLGFKHSIQVDKHEFILQKKGIPLEQVFAKAHSTEEVREKIGQLVELIQKRCEKGVGDRDPAFAQNVAFCPEENQPIFIDIGQLYLHSMSVEEEQAEVSQRLKSLHIWMNRHFPELASIYF